jgi:hypothetical protein
MKTRQWGTHWGMQPGRTSHQGFEPRLPLKSPPQPEGITVKPSKHCPYDPSTLVDTPFDRFPCPVCGCAVYAGFQHAPCVDPVCHFHDATAASRLRHPSTLLPAWR